MNRIAFPLLLATLFFITGFKPADDVFKVDITKSSISWIGRKVTGQHSGAIQLSSGSLTFKKNRLTSGNFIADMTTIKSGVDGSVRLDTHLKADDFFGVAKYPESSFKITQVNSLGADKATITGDLTIKGITNSLTFQAVITITNDEVVAIAQGIKINRTKYNIRYGSKSFFDSIGDKAIDDEFELSIKLVAKK